MNKCNSLENRILAVVLCIVIMLGMLPSSAFAVNPSTLTTDIGEKIFVVGETTEFRFTTVANDDAGIYVLGTFEFSDPSAVEKLEYLEVQSGKWFEFYGDFGPATGFPMTDAISRFRVSFNKAGTYTVKASMVTAEDRTVLCSVEETVSVRRNASVLTTDMGSVPFVVGEVAEFTFTTTANDDANALVLGTFEFSDPSAVAKLEYLEVQTGKWFEFYGDFGPATGFPMTDATSRFRVSFNKAGTYTVKASMVTAEDRTVLCSVEETVSVRDVKPSTLTTNIGDLTFLTGKTAEFTFTTTANDDANTLVLGTFEFSDPSAVAKLEYLEVQTGKWFEFYGDFGPATGFPMTDATSRFRVTFNKAGTYTVKAAMVKADDRTELCNVEKTVSVRELKASVLTTTLGQDLIVVGKRADFTFTTIANEHAGMNVLGSFEFSDPSAVAKLEYLEVQTGKWFEFYGDFGPATGFPMTDATSRFRVTFNKAGTYTVKVSMVRADDRTVLSSLEKEIIVADTCKLTTDIDRKSFVTGQTQEFTFTTIANGDAGTQVLGTFEFSDRSAIEKLEYLEVQSGKWFEFYGDFGPAGTGFPMTDATSRFRVTFKKYGNYKVIASMKAVDGGAVLCSVTKDITVQPAEQTGFHFTTPFPADQWIGASYTNEAIGGQTNKDVVYEVVEGPATIHGATIKFTGLGKVTVKATRPGDDFYKEAVDYYTVTSILHPWAPFTFAISNPKIVYQPGLTYPNAENKNDLNKLDSAVTFAIVDGENLILSNEVATIDAATGVLSILKSGTVTVRATRNTDNYYLSASSEYTLTVEKAVQTISFMDVHEDDELTYQTETMELPEITGQLSGEALIYNITTGNDDIAKIDENGKLQLLKSGEFVMTIVSPGNDCYHESNLLSWNVKVKKAQQTGFNFAVENDVITYNDVDKNAAAGSGVANEYTMITDGGQSEGSVSYQIVDGEAASFEKDGVLTIHKSGTVKVKAVKAGDDRYEDAIAYFELKVEKAEQSFTFVHDKNIQKEYGLLEYPTEIVASALNSGSIVYVASKNAIGATVDSASGLVSFAPSEGKVGSVTVTVTMVGDDCYKSFSDSYIITLDYEDPTATYTLSGNKINPDGQWFTGDVTILAPDGYEISYKNDLLDNEWKHAVVWTIDGQEGTWDEGAKPVVYLKNSTTNAITDAIFVSDLKRDTQKPSGLAISYDATVWAIISEKLFGFSAGNVKVTVSAADSMSDIAKMDYSVDGGHAYKEIIAENGEYVFLVSEQYRGQLCIKATDVAGNEEIYKHLNNGKDQVLVIDKTAPGLTVGYQGGLDDTATEEIRYAQGEVAVTFKVTDENFDLRDTQSHNPVVKVNGDNVEGWVFNDTPGNGFGELTFKLSAEGDYVIDGSFTDRLGRVVTHQSEVRIDWTKPAITSDIVNGHYYTDGQKFVLTIKEHNFDATKVDLVVSAKDSAGHTVLEDKTVSAFKADAKNPSKWTHNDSGDEHTLVLDIHEDGNYTVKVDCVDKLGNSADTYICEFVMDKTEPIQPVFEYKTVKEETILGKLFGFSKERVRVTIKTGDATSSVDYIEVNMLPEGPAESTKIALPVALKINADGSIRSGEKGSIDYIGIEGGADDLEIFFDVPAEARVSFSAVVYDKAGRFSQFSDDGSVIVTDTVNSNVTINYTALEYEKGFRDANNTPVASEKAEKLYYNEKVEAKITIDEANFFEGMKTGGENESVVHQMLLKVTKTDDQGVKTVTEYLCDGAEQLVEGAQKKIIAWDTKNNTHTTVITFQEDGDYVLELFYQDFSGNDTSIEGTDGKTGYIHYISKTITVDQTAPEIKISYNNVTPLNGNCYKDNRVAVIEVEEHNFRAEEFVVAVTAKNILDNDVAVMDYVAYAQDPKNWTHDGNKHTLKLTFSEDAIYTFSGSCTDMAGNYTAFEEPDFVVDHTAAAEDSIKINYTTHFFSKVIETLTFGFYQSDVVVTVTAEDWTSGVDYFELTYTRDENATDAHTDTFTETLMANSGEDKKTFVASYEVSAQARGSFSVVVYDRAGNSSGTDDHNRVIVADTEPPKVQVDFTSKDPATKVHFVDKNIKDVSAFEEAANAFYNGDVVATITVNEANFFEGKMAGENNGEIVHEIIIKVTKTDDNGVKTVKEYLCAGAEQKVLGAQKEIIRWTTMGDEHTAEITFADDGDYVLELSYTDFSGNVADISGNDGVSEKEHYTSKVITVDETAPIIDVTYGNTEVINTIDNIQYFNKTQSAVIKVTEHNFRAEDIAAVITAKNIIDADVAVADFAAQLQNEDSWKHDGNVHTAELQYTVDANYTFDIDYEDLALNVSADYKQDLFTVDTTAPKNLTVSYSTSFFEQVKQSITFGYYNARMTVTITAEDETSGIYHFAYSYIKGKNVSGVNAQLLDQAIREAEITYQGKKATATFHIPKMVLGNDNQFNGTVEFTAYDRSENNTQLKDSKVIIVDNISPTSKITYNAPVQTENGTSYYAGDINATIVINEANFDAKDVVVSVTQNGKTYPVNVAWRDNSVDTHTGSFTLKEDGDYIVSVRYKDKSGNQMASYTSNKLTRDTVKPTIKVSNIKANSANKDEKYGFVITVDDINLDASTIKPVLKTVLMQEDGKYATVEIDLGQVTTVAKGKTYSYTVEDLPDDGLYTLTCEVKDMSANTMTQIVLDDGQSYEQVQFSINRKGSVFAYGNEFTSALVEQYYIYSVAEDLVVLEVNVDPIEQYKVTLNGKDLIEGTDYTTEQTSNNGEWSKRTYTVKKELFEKEGEYNIIVSSTDKASTTAFSDVKDLSMAFVVDQTKPDLVITGLESGGRYRTTAQTVTLIPTDEGGRLNSLSVVVLASDGTPLKDKETNEDISVRFEMSGDELLKHLEENDGKITFTIPNGLNHKVQITCNDCAQHDDNTTNEYAELFNRVTVSDNGFVILFANTYVFVGLIIGLLALIVLLIVLISKFKKKKK